MTKSSSKLLCSSLRRGLRGQGADLFIVTNGGFKVLQGAVGSGSSQVGLDKVGVILNRPVCVLKCLLVPPQFAGCRSPVAECCAFNEPLAME